MSKKEKSAARSCVWHITLSVLMTFVAMILSTFLVSNVLLKEVDSELLRSLVFDAIMMAVYAISFYKFHQTDRIMTYAKHTERFDAKAEILAYFRREGKYMVIFFAVCAVLREIFNVIPTSAVSFIGTIFVDVLLNPMVNFIKIPVFSSVLAFVYACVVLGILVIIRSRKIHQIDMNAKKH